MGLQCHFGLEIFARKIFTNKTQSMKKQLLFLFFFRGFGFPNLNPNYQKGYYRVYIAPMKQ